MAFSFQNISSKDKVMILISGISALGALAGILLYFDRKKTMKLQHEISSLDKQIKELQLFKLKNATV